MPESASLIHSFVVELNGILQSCAVINDRYYNSFEYTRTRQNYCHSRTIGLLAKYCWSIPGVAALDIDMHYNLGQGIKFQPDLVAVDAHDQPLLVIDFESPNSSDARIPEKDIVPYAKWTESSGLHPPYVIITSLPKRVRMQRPRARGRSTPKRSPAWEVRYTSPGWTNYDHRDFAEEIKYSPFDYWVGWYRDQVLHLVQESPEIAALPIYFVNLDGARAKLVDIRKEATG